MLQVVQGPRRFAGIKEDLEPDPSPGGTIGLGGSIFLDNYMDYYDSSKTSLDLSE